MTYNKAWERVRWSKGFYFTNYRLIYHALFSVECTFVMVFKHFTLAAIVISSLN